MYKLVMGEILVERKAQLRPVIVQRVLDEYKYTKGPDYWHHLWTTLGGIDHVASMRHCGGRG